MRIQKFFQNYTTNVVILIVCFMGVLSSPISAQQHGTVMHRQSPALPEPPPIAKPSAPPNGQENELVLPQVTPEIIGLWGGHLYQMSSNGPSLHASPTSLLFGQRGDGTIYVRTGIWGKTDARIVNATAQVLTPNRIKITEEHLVSADSRVLRVTQKYSLLLKDKKVIDCLETVQINSDGSSSPYERPIDSVNFHGVLRILSDKEDNEIRTELLREGDVSQGTVEGSKNFSQ